jgi:hypothetical protein
MRNRDHGWPQSRNADHMIGTQRGTIDSRHGGEGAGNRQPPSESSVQLEGPGFAAVVLV